MENQQETSEPLGSTLISKIKSVLIDLHSNPSPPVEQPTSCKKRASVALILRIRPQFPQTGAYDTSRYSRESSSFQSNVENFFSQDWVRTGEPEILFIKRSSRNGDRWTGHIAFPGGKREAGDVDDNAASIRETREEVGLDLSAEHCLYIGNLPERVITTNWGKIPLMVLCPFVHLLLRHDIPPLNLQPTEVHSAHWVPVRSLLSPHLRTYERADISDRLKPQRGALAKNLIRLTTGQFVFRATFLTPSESLYSNPGQTSASQSTVTGSQKPGGDASIWPYVINYFLPKYSTSSIPLSSTTPLRLWGLTLGMVSDFLQEIDVEATQSLWSWPTFSHWDIRFVVWLLTRHIRRQQKISTSIIEQKAQNISQRDRDASTSKEQQKGQPVSDEHLRVNGIDDTTFTATTTIATASSGPLQSSPASKRKAQRPHLGLPAADILDAYFRQMYKGVVLAVALRINTIAILTVILFWRRRKLRKLN